MDVNHPDVQRRLMLALALYIQQRQRLVDAFIDTSSRRVHVEAGRDHCGDSLVQWSLQL